MTQSKGVVIIAVEPGSLAEAAGLEPGDRIIMINDEPVLDQLNYQFLVSQRDTTHLIVQKVDGSLDALEVANGGDGLGVDLAPDEVKVCKQNCVFCFVRQMPKGFRQSLYLKDEDVRLSFLYGHFTTLSSSDTAELDRIVREHMSPIHVSVHATDPEVRIRVVGNPREGNILAKLDRLLAGGIDVHTQVVLAPDLNDGPAWERTLTDLAARRKDPDRPNRGGVLSLSCVPVGLTDHREGLPFVRPVDEAYARAFLARWKPEVSRYADAWDGEPWLLLADEWFTRARRPIPGRAFYSRTWAQLENGVGLIRRYLEHTRNFLRRPKARGYAGRRLLLLTGASFAPSLERTLARLNRTVGSHLRALAVPNRTFGEQVTVAGLLCGKDLVETARADRQAHGNRPDWVEAVVIPSAALRTHPGPTDQYTLAGGSTHAQTPFLDDWTLSDVERALGVPVIPSGDNLSQLLDHLQDLDAHPEQHG